MRSSIPLPPQYLFLVQQYEKVFDLYWSHPLLARPSCSQNVSISSVRATCRLDVEGSIFMPMREQSLRRTNHSHSALVRCRYARSYRICGVLRFL